MLNLVLDYAIGEIAAGVQHRQSCLSSRTVNNDIAAVCDSRDRCFDVGSSRTIRPLPHPGKLAQYYI
ncbi:MAG TPA: hypothetical protein VMB34_15105 [Acetobacteraceae bacterium]|nr:hypothetical protein [Acetobacteraceae bacterium]